MKISIRWALIAGFLGLIWGTQMIITSTSYVSSEQVLMNHAKNILSNITDFTAEQSMNHLGLAQGAAHLTKLMISDHVVG
jgi:N-acetylmuramic acid 6-phosphate (MurNAc-6-P) etherase